MAVLIGYLQGNRGMASRLGTKKSGIHAKLATWRGAVTVWLDADGSFRVCIDNDIMAGGGTRLTGNVNTGEAEYHGGKR